MDNSTGMVVRTGSARYLLDQGPSRYGMQQEPVTLKRPLGGGFNTSTPYRPQPQRFTAVSNNRLIAQVPASPPANNAQALKKSFTADYQNDFQNQANRFARTADKSKGLRHFSTKVCEKVKEKGRTNYNEVADELVSEYFDSLSMPMSDGDKQSYDMKNIRRRVYDALNVLMAMNIIEKEKKEIRWVGLPTSSVQECRRLEEEKARRSERIKEKTDSLFDLVMQLVAYKSLVERNRDRERSEGRPADNSILFLPFVVVNTDKRTVVECSISPEKTEYVFSFDHPFEIQDDIEVLKRLGFAQGLETGEVTDEIRPKIKSCLPSSLRAYVDAIIEGAFVVPMRQPQFTRPAVEQKKPVLMASQSQMVGARPMVRVNRPMQGQAHTTVTVPRYMNRPQPIQPQPRYIQSNVIVRQPQAQERYTYTPQQTNGGQQKQQYVVRQMYAPTGQQQYMDDMYDDEEGDQMEYEG
ncbi:hypothetical protein PFISCL1PPCAC_24781 [Pristionchus fissidentatus]|uniref:Uncharacterized protein n=1 Tax=Pristionchus fissidentatus TaxID=1538716 RepID=A0AAV5WMX0_9BILA|nr:hypothetical protein PFISCL1PPCAC_24781 [Pristionchus fissidentatus]